MTAETDLLPLPEPNGSYTNPYDGDDLENYARARVAHATAAKDAEIDALRSRLEDTVRDSTNKIEALQAEVESVTCELMDAITRADKLEEALREAKELIEELTDDSNYERWDDLLRDKEEGSGAFWGPLPKVGESDWTGYDG